VRRTPSSPRRPAQRRTAGGGYGRDSGPSPGFCNERIHLRSRPSYSAPVLPQPDDDSWIKCIRGVAPKGDALRLVWSGELSDGQRARRSCTAAGTRAAPVEATSVALGWHVHPVGGESCLGTWCEPGAEEVGYTAASIGCDGDLSMLSERSEADALDGWTVTTALLRAHAPDPDRSRCALVHHWNAARLAQAVATSERLAPGAPALPGLGGRPCRSTRASACRSPARRRGSRAWTRTALGACARSGAARR